MEAQDTSSIPSLYGPGAVICWICIIISVLVSWACNNKTRFHDTISTDLVATLSLPLIATIQFLHELDSSGGKDWIQPGIRDVTFTICGIYTWVSPVLLGLGICHSAFRRTGAVGLVGILCAMVSIVAISKTEPKDVRKKESTAWTVTVSLVPLLVNIGITVVVFVTRLHPKPIQNWMESRRKTVKWLCTASFLIAMGTVVLGAFGWLARSSVTNSRLFVPSTPYRITDLDQAVALTAGILTVLISTIDAFLSRDLSDWEAFEDWRQRSRIFLDAKIIEDAEAAVWKREMDAFDGKVDEILKHRMRVNLDKLMKQHADRIDAEEQAKTDISFGTW